MSEYLMVPREYADQLQEFCASLPQAHDMITEEVWVMNSEVKPQVVWLPDGFGGGEHAAVCRASDYAALEAECVQLRSERDAFRDSRNYLIEEISSHLSEIAELREALRDTARWIERLPVQAQGAIRQLERIDAALSGITDAKGKHDHQDDCGFTCFKEIPENGLQ